MDQHVLLETMLQAVREAGGAACEIQRAGRLGIVNKEGVFGTHFLTEADLASEKVILSRLGRVFPGYPVISEEKENDPVIPPDAFLVDPVDGTPCFIHGCDEWGVMLTKLNNYVPEVAVVYVPGRELLAYAVRGHGCYLNNKKIVLGEWPQELRDKTMLGIELGPWWAKASLPATVLLPLLERFAIRSLLSGAYGTIAMLRGETQAWINLNVGWPWDFAPGTLFMEEVGGWVSGPDGLELEFKRVEHMDVIYAVNEEMARQVLALTTRWSQARSR